MMEQPKEKPEMTPAELWDQLAVSQLLKALAPNGFKKIMNGKIEVVASQFVRKETVHSAQVMAANMIRLYREILRENLYDLLKKAEESISDSEKALKEAGVFEIGAKKSLETLIARKQAEHEVIKQLLSELDKIKPRAPRNQKPRPAKSPIMKVNGQHYETTQK